MSTPALVSYLVLWLLVLLVIAAVVLMARQIGLIHARMPPVGSMMTSNGPDLGEAFPERNEEALNGSTVRLGGSRASAQLLVFMRPRCAACSEVAPAVRTIARREHDLETVVVMDAQGDPARQFGRRSKLDSIPMVASEDLVHEMMIMSSPFAIYLDTGGIVRAKGGINTLQQLEGLIDAGRAEWPGVQLTGDLELTIREPAEDQSTLIESVPVLGNGSQGDRQ